MKSLSNSLQEKSMKLHIPMEWGPKDYKTWSQSEAKFSSGRGRLTTHSQFHSSGI